MPRWTPEDAPRVDGALALVTGASSGLGAATATALAGRGARVLLANRDTVRTAIVADRIRARFPGAVVEHVPLDLAALSSVATAVERVRAEHGALDLLVANAGVMATPYVRTVDGFELQLAVDHLGHQALVAGLLPELAAAPAGRIVVVSSGLHRIGRIDVEDLDWERRRYRPWQAYADAKLANLLFVAELARRLALAGSPVTALAAHPGLAATELQAVGPGMRGGLRGRLASSVVPAASHLVAQSAERGALPQLRAALDRDLPSGTFLGPDGFGAMRGWPTVETPSRRARDPELAHRLWDETERRTGVRAPLPG
ncbi:MAG: hypothetical protein RLZZ272_615 [Actinomycetota bacterium]